MTTNEELALTDATAELAIAQIYVLPETIQAEDAVTLGADVRNDGTAESGAFQVRFTLDNSETHDVEFSTIPPGASHWEEWMHEPLTPGEHLLAVQLDVQDQVREGNKYDNAASLAFQVMAAPTYENMTSDDA
jgi:subtilase family serine protease